MQVQISLYGVDLINGKFIHVAENIEGKQG